MLPNFGFVKICILVSGVVITIGQYDSSFTNTYQRNNQRQYSWWYNNYSQTKETPFYENNYVTTRSDAINVSPQNDGSQRIWDNPQVITVYQPIYKWQRRPTIEHVVQPTVPVIIADTSNAGDDIEWTLSEGDLCYNNHFQLQGICTLSSSCNAAGEGVPIEICSLKARQKIICCPHAEWQSQVVATSTNPPLPEATDINANKNRRSPDNETRRNTGYLDQKPESQTIHYFDAIPDDDDFAPAKVVNTSEANYAPTYDVRVDVDSKISDAVPVRNTVLLPVSEINERISDKKCKEYSRLSTQTIGFSPLTATAPLYETEVPNCSFEKPLIVGGEKAKRNEFPHMAALGWTQKDGTINWNCGGSLINEKFILTAAHCVIARPYPDVVRLGEQSLTLNSTDEHPINFNVRKVVLHPEYRASSLYHDIALVQLVGGVTFSESIRPACLWPSDDQTDYSEVVASGWGKTSFAGDASEDLLKVALQIIPKSICEQQYQQQRKLVNGVLPSQLCVGSKVSRRDTCQGDSGGPIQVLDKDNVCIYYVVGITSFGKFCGAANTPGMYTKVAYYLDWIESVVWPNQ